MIRLIIVYFIFCGQSLSAQNERLLIPDSIQQRIDTIHDNDKKIEAHLDLYGRYRGTDPEKSVWHARTALILSNASQNNIKKGACLDAIGTYHLNQRNSDSARFYFGLAMLNFKKAGEQISVGDMLMKMGRLDERDGNIVNSFVLISMADSIYKSEPNNPRILESQLALGILSSRQGEDNRAIEFYKSAENYASENPVKQALIYSNVSAVYSRLGDFENAYHYGLKSLKILTDINNYRGIADVCQNLAYAVYVEKGPTDEVVTFYERSIEGYKIRESEGLGIIEDRLGLINAYNELATVHTKRGEYDEAKTCLVEAEKLSSDIVHFNTELVSAEAWYTYYRDIKDWENAFTCLLRFNELEDSVNTLEKINVIEELQTKYETRELEKEKELAITNQLLSDEKANRSKNVSIIVIVSCALGIFGLFFVYYRFRQRKKREILNLKLETAEKALSYEKENRLAELKVLRSQMNPHFIFNTLNSIQDLILLSNKRDSLKYLGKFGELTRQILTNSNQAVISVKDEIAMIELYAEFERLRFGDQLEFKITSELTEKDSEEFTLPSMFIQPYIENAFKHGLIHKQGKKKLNVNFYRHGEALVCSIKDNGIGRKKAAEIKQRREKTHLNFSTAANVKRIDLLNEEVREKIKLNILDDYDGEAAIGTTVNIYFN